MRLTPRLIVEVGLPSLFASFLVAGMAHMVRSPSPRPAQASVVATPEEGLTAIAMADSNSPEMVEVPAATSGDATRGRYRLRVGVFGVLSNAMQLAEDLRSAGYRPEVVPRRNDRDQELYFLYAVSYDDPDEAERAAEELRQNGQEVFIEEGELATG